MVDDRTRAANQAAYRAAGYTGEFGGGKASAWKNAQGADFINRMEDLKKDFYQGKSDARPTTVASMNPYQREALTEMGQSSAPVDPRAGNAYDRASQSFDAGTYKQFMNPYTQEVIDRTRQNITRGYDQRRNALNEQMASAGGFGSTAQGTEQAQITEAQERQLGDIAASQLAQGFDSAMGRAQSLYGTDIGKNLAVAGGYQGLDQYGRNIALGDMQRKLAAGGQIQGQNQAVLDAYYRERGRAEQDPYSQLEFYKSILGAYPTGSSQTSTSPGVGMAQGALGGALLGSEFFGGDSGGGNTLISDASYRPNYLPWRV